jgi:hypothetical protein
MAPTVENSSSIYGKTVQAKNDPCKDANFLKALKKEELRQEEVSSINFAEARLRELQTPDNKKYVFSDEQDFISAISENHSLLKKAENRLKLKEILIGKTGGSGSGERDSVAAAAGTMLRLNRLKSNEDQLNAKGKELLIQAFQTPPIIRTDEFKIKLADMESMLDQNETVQAREAKAFIVNHIDRLPFLAYPDSVSASRVRDAISEVNKNPELVTYYKDLFFKTEEAIKKDLSVGSEADHLESSRERENNSSHVWQTISKNNCK